jgi:enamine deaminase RidA (YjgF/YER057c/UK114 family)
MNKLATCHSLFGSLLLLAFAVPVLAQGSRQKAEIVVPEDARSSYENWGYAPAVKIGNTIYVSGVVSYLEGEGSYEERYARGFKTALNWIEKILNEAGASLDDVVDIISFHTDLQRQLEVAIKARMEAMSPPHPAWTAVGTTALASPDGVTEIKVVAYVP